MLGTQEYNISFYVNLFASISYFGKCLADVQVPCNPLQPCDCLSSDCLKIQASMTPLGG